MLTENLSIKGVILQKKIINSHITTFLKWEEMTPDETVKNTS
jgi:hypothetical protein